MNVAALVGGQFGSEGKGLIAGHIAKDYDNHVRVGAANAGHTVYTPKQLYQVAIVDERDPSKDRPLEPTHEKHVMQSIPCAAYANPDAKLYLGPGALINIDILEREIQQRREWGDQYDLPWTPLMVDTRAHVVQELHKLAESASDLQERIGSTSATAREGIGSATAARVMRDATCVLAPYDETLQEMAAVDLIRFADVPTRLHLQHSILMEGTQGADLSLTTGLFPYVTSRNTTSAGLCADCGIPPNRVDRVIMVCRTYPIRVAGPSGPFWPDSEEIEWSDIGVDQRQELTTVTKKVRRVATFSHGQISHSAMINGATEIALTFCDYLDPGIRDVSGPIPASVVEKRYPKIFEVIDRIEETTHTPVTMLGTGPHSVIDLEPNA